MKSFLFSVILLIATTSPAAESGKALYENNFDKAEIGKLPDGFLALEGEFVVREEGTNKFLELPGAPLDNFAVQFGPAEGVGVQVSARIFGTAKGRRYPTFGIGLGGVVGYRLQISPGKKALELYRDQDFQVSVPFDWKPGSWTALRLQVRKIKGDEWKVEGKVWPIETSEPSAWQIEFVARVELPTGRASVFGSPFSSTPIWFDDLMLGRVPASQP